MGKATSYKAFKCRLYPNPVQEAYFRKMFHCCRVVYNHFLEVRIAAYEARCIDGETRIPSHFDMCRMLTAFKKEELDPAGHPYLKDVDSTALIHEVKYLDTAFDRFFRRVEDKPWDPGYPKFKGPSDKDSATIAFKRADFVERRRIRFAKIGWVKASAWRELEGELVSCTVSVDEAGRWWASLLCKGVPNRELPASDSVAVVRLDGKGASMLGEISGSASDRPAPDCSASYRPLPDCSKSVDPDSPEAIAARREARRRRRERRRLERRKSCEGKGQAREGQICAGQTQGASNRYRKEKLKAALREAREIDRAQTQALQAVSALVRENGTIVLVGKPRGSFEQELARRLERKCGETGREFLRETK